MNWFYLALVPPLLFSMVNHFDKYLVQRFFKGAGVGAVLIFSALVGVVAAIPIALFVPAVFDLSAWQSALIVANGFLYLLASLPYFYALAKDEASVVIPFFQLIPFFILLFGFVLLGESIDRNSFIGGLLIVFGAVLISLELTHKKVRLKQSVLWLMVLSSALFALNFVLFKNFAIETTFWVTSFWEYLGFTLFGLLALALIKPYRREFLLVFNQNKTTVLTVNIINEAIGLAAKATFNFVTLLAPIALVSFLGGLQPLFVLVIGTGLTILFPKLSREKIDVGHMGQKVVAIGVIILGVWLLNFANQ
ncbi:MAG: EamA family transporter [Parcubacteria group bacterium]